MKKGLLAIVIVFLLTSVGLKSQTNCYCPAPGFVHTLTTTISDGVNSCQVTVIFCKESTKLSSVGDPILPFRICEVIFHGNCYLNLDLSSTFWDKLNEKIVDYLSNSTTNTEYYDCDGPIRKKYYEATKAKCWILENDWENQQFVFTPCENLDDTRCITEYTVCWLNGVKQITKGTSTVQGTADCYFEIPNVFDPNTFPFNECFETCY